MGMKWMLKKCKWVVLGSVVLGFSCVWGLGVVVCFWLVIGVVCWMVKCFSVGCFVVGLGSVVFVL